MQRYDIPPLYFPSMVMLVDDSRAFLDNLGLQLDANLAFRLYDSPFDALVDLNGSSSSSPLVERFFSVSHFGDDLPLSHHVLDLNLDHILREVHNRRRFERVSVVVVDYDMPEVDGLAFCRNIKNPAIKKILLTGKADEKLAVQAFNQRLIDRFILKQDAEVIPTLNQAIAELQLAYFQEMARTVGEALSLGSHSFLQDAAFAGTFHRIRAERGIVEFYLTSTPDGFLMLDAQGAAHLLIIKTAEELESHFDIAQDQGAPAALLARLASKRYVPYFRTPQGEYHPSCPDWRSCLYPATALQGQEWYYYAVVSNPAGRQFSDIASYRDFLAWLDTQGTPAPLSNG
ncbi:MAG: response regulator [Paludibacterium sp.]|uniref:response regulator n=1 Tax=Paludibacterium sp. TaxID=1917523 RepID=UPI0025CE1714|nr:response regulator [Paludibacterium sp.]MBV8046438.1 response regulator [Paludibacterium sp.]MBV8645830.1 response regulator [Paludibacterium sp.]